MYFTTTITMSCVTVVKPSIPGTATRRFGRMVSLTAAPDSHSGSTASPTGPETADVYRLIADICTKAGTFDGTAIRDLIWAEHSRIKRGELVVNGTFTLCASVFGVNMNYPVKILNAFTTSDKVVLTTEDIAKLLGLDLSGNARSFHFNRLCISLGVLEAAGKVVKLPKIRTPTGVFYPRVLAENRNHPAVFDAVLKNLDFNVLTKVLEVERKTGRPCTRGDIVIPRKTKIAILPKPIVVVPICASQASVRKCFNRQVADGNLVFISSPGARVSGYSARLIASEIDFCLRGRILTETMHAILLGTSRPRTDKTVFEDTHLRLVREVMMRDMHDVYKMAYQAIADNLGINASSTVKKMLKKQHLVSNSLTRETLLAHAESAAVNDIHMAARIRHYVDKFYPV